MYKAFESKIIVEKKNNKRFFLCAEDCKYIAVNEVGVPYCKFWLKPIPQKSNKLMPIDDCLISTLFPEYDVYEAERKSVNEM